MKELTFEEAVKWHREMWNWIAEQVKKDRELMKGSNLSPGTGTFKTKIVVLKHQWCNDHGFPNILSHCFGCEYDNQMMYKRIFKDINDLPVCHYCPFIWTDSGDIDPEGDDRFCDFGIITWSRSDPEIIANIPVREKYPEEE